jgi:DnaJ-class molecular chaperone
MRLQKCSDPAKFCDACNGFGYVVRGFGLHPIQVKAMVEAGLGDEPIDTAEVECKACAGSGRRTFRKST